MGHSAQLAGDSPVRSEKRPPGLDPDLDSHLWERRPGCCGNSQEAEDQAPFPSPD